MTLPEISVKNNQMRISILSVFIRFNKHVSGDVRAHKNVCVKLAYHFVETHYFLRVLALFLIVLEFYMS